MLSTYHVLSRPHDGPADDVFLREREQRGHHHVAMRNLRHRVAEDVLGDARVLSTFDSDAGRETLADTGEALVLLRSWRSDSDVLASAASPEVARRVVDDIKARVERCGDPRAVDVRFTDANAGDRTLQLAVRPWAEIEHLYPHDVRTALGPLMTHVHDVDEPRRLLLWHGAPGTGKTTAVRALLQAWRSWADGLVITDPDRLLNEGRYLRRVLLDVDDDEGRWQVVVLEDAEALVNQAAGPALGKVLNLADGLLGQGLRCLFLLTTNTPLTGLHPAVTRPGRCLARVEFGELSAGEAARVLGRPVDRPRTLAEVLAERTVTNTPDTLAVGQYL